VTQQVVGLRRKVSTMAMSPIDKRNFYLSLSIMEGQKIASNAGFAVPSAEVQESEIVDTISKWVILTGLGIFDNVKQCSDWMLEVVKVHNDLDDDELESTQNVLMSFGMSLISHLVDNELLELPETTHAPVSELNREALLNLLSFRTDSEDDEEEDDE
jgi:hypothetical protein